MFVNRTINQSIWSFFRRGVVVVGIIEATNCEDLAMLEMYLDFLDTYYVVISKGDPRQNNMNRWQLHVNRDMITKNVLQFNEIQANALVLQKRDKNILSGNTEKIENMNTIWINPLVSLFKKIPKYGLGQTF